MSKPKSPIQLARQSFKKTKPTRKRKDERKSKYDEAKARFRANTKLQCEMCAKPETNYRKLEIHHTIGRMGSRLWDIRFFALLCHECHMKAHNNVKWARKNGWIKVLTRDEENERKDTL